MRFHIVGLPHSQILREYSSCAFTAKIRNFTKMMSARGHEVIVYAGEQIDVPCHELVTCFTEEQRAEHVGKGHYTAARWSAADPAWIRLNETAVREIGKRAGPHDFVLASGGICHHPIGDALTQYAVVEYGIGYNRTFARYRVFESYAWMHMIYGAQAHESDPYNVNGEWFDGVVPGYLDMDDFPTRDDGEGYYLFIGRLVQRKGYEIAIDVCRELGEKLVIAGPGEAPPGTRHVGVVEPAVRAHLMAGAKAVFVPTVYVEPFGNVAIEAMACGTPVITTDWGAFTETVQQGVTGFRCRYFGEFLRAAIEAPRLDRAAIRQYAESRYSLEVVARKYEDYFARLSLIWSDGWYAKT